MDLDLRQSADGSFSAYNKDFSQCYHSLKCGALSESLHKHILPTFLLYASKKICATLNNQTNNLHTHNFTKNFSQFFTNYLSDIVYDNNAKKELAILDICFGLGYNTFASIYFYSLFGFPCKLRIYTPELDEKMLKNLQYFPYPKEFSNINIQAIMHDLLTYQRHDLPHCSIELFIGDATNYLKMLPTQSLDIIYHDAFSPKENPKLWSVEFFSDLYAALRGNGIISTYSQSRTIRENAFSQGFLVYDCRAKLCDIKTGSLMSKRNIECIALLSQFYQLTPYKNTLMQC